MKVVINCDYGGFGPSYYAKGLLIGKGYDLDWSLYENRAHPALIECIETIGKKADNMFSNLKIINIPDNCYDISEHDGWESLYYPSQKWIKPKYE